MVVACCGPKGDAAAPAGELYRASSFALMRDAALAEVGGDRARVFIMSARYGLVNIDDVIEPYDMRLTDDGAVDDATLIAQAIDAGFEDVYVFGPTAYVDRLRCLFDVGIYPMPVFEGVRGIGDMRHGAVVIRDMNDNEEDAA